MKNIEKLDYIMSHWSEFPDLKINSTFLMAYRDSIRSGCEMLNFQECIWDYDIDPIIALCKEYGITEFAISSNFSGVLETIWKFTERGCRMDGMIEVTSKFKDIFTDEYGKVAAALIRI